VEFARAEFDDWPRIWPVWHEVVQRGDTYTYDSRSSSEDGRRIWMQPAPAQIWMVTSDDTGEVVLGTYLLKANQPGNGDHVANAGFMVSGAARGRGVGRAMGEHCLDQARRAGYVAMQFNAVVASNHGAIKLWYALGFETIGTVPRAFRHPTDGLVGLHIMYRDL
jgi:GNAT superfamily N-acetyltransferase